MQKELEQLPETLKELDPVQRLNILCKLMPYVLPKTESVKHNFGEPVSFVAQADGSLKYDLASVPNGTYTLTVAACNMWGFSSTAPFSFSKQIPSAPAGLRIVAD